MNIDEVILQYSTRGMDILQKYHKKEHCKNAVKHFLTLDKGTVFLYTGFYINGFAETDGPIGTYFLAKALIKLNYKPIIITDKYCKNYFNEIRTIYIDINHNQNNYYQKLLDNHNPICHISIERCGKNINGKYENARGIDISDFTANIDELFKLGNITKPSYAIGDGGNEIGMANFNDTIREHFSIVPCEVKCDYVIIASVSNWGAYGFIAYLQKFTKEKVLPTFNEVDLYLEYIVSLGCIDGIKQKQVKSVDGKDWNIEINILKDLNSCII